MKFTIPLYIATESGQGAAGHRVRPLFFDGPYFTDQILGKAIDRCVSNAFSAPIVAASCGDALSRW